MFGLTLACTPSDPEPAAMSRATALDDRDQYQLAHLLEEATRDGVGTELRRLHNDWIDRRYRWEVAYTPVFCRDGERCAALPFDHARLQSSTPHGWLPQLEIDAAQRRSLAERCAELEGQCVFEFEATMTQFEVGLERATTIGFEDVTLTGFRTARATESWVRRVPGESHQ
jgi:hypothetical protein